MHWRAHFLVPATLAVLAAAAAPARAAVGASASGGTLSVTLSTPGDLARVHRVGGEIRVADGSGRDVADGVALASTTAVTIEDHSSGGTTAVIDRPGRRAVRER